MRSIVKCIYDHAQSRGDKIAIIGCDCTVTYARLWEMVSGCATLLKNAGEKGRPGDAGS